MVLSRDHSFDIVMLGTFAAWRLGTLQSRALPLAAELNRRGMRCAVVTTPWDMPSERGIIDVLDGVPLFNTSAASTLATIQAVLQQTRIVRDLRPRAAHVIKPRGFGGFSGWRLERVLPVLVDSDDWEGDGGWNRIGSYGIVQRRLFNWQERAMLRSATGVTAASTLLHARALAARGGSGAWLVPNGLRRAWFTDLATNAATADRESDRRPTVVLYSRFAEFGDDWLARFIAALDGAVASPVRLDIIGANARTFEPVPEVDRVEVRMHGYVDRGSLPELLGAADVAVYPYESSLITLSKQSVKLLELMAARCAVVASDVGDIPAVLADTGVVVSGANPVAFAKIAAYLLSHATIAATLGDAASRRVHDRFLIESTVADQLLGAYRAAGVLTE